MLFDIYKYLNLAGWSELDPTFDTLVKHKLL
jgi:hypothetical protein